MAGGVTSPPICLAACSIVVPGATSMEMLSMVTFIVFISSDIFNKSKFKIEKSKTK
jgi:hypothetical protein